MHTSCLGHLLQGVPKNMICNSPLKKKSIFYVSEGVELKLIPALESKNIKIYKESPN